MNKFLGYHCAHERFSPSTLLHLSKLASEHGFNGISCSDHFYPWSVQQGQSGFAWSWLGAAMAQVNLKFGIINAPVQRYHPVIIAQAAATLAEMFPQRFWCAFGSGQWLNEHITNNSWPTKTARNARLKEAVSIIKALWRGETITMKGEFYELDEVKLYTLPAQQPLLLGAALTPESAESISEWADGIITTSKIKEDQIKFIAAFLSKDPSKKLFLQALHSYHSNKKQAEQNAIQNWPLAGLGNSLQSEIKKPQLFDEAFSHLNPTSIVKNVRISSSLQEHLQWLCEDYELGFEEIYLQEVSNDQDRIIQSFGAEILPHLG